MATLQYLAIDAQGRRIRAKEEALDSKNLEKELESRGLTVIEIREAGSLWTSLIPSFQISEKTEKEDDQREIKRGRVTRRDVIEFCIYMGTLTESGISLPIALRDFAEESQNPYMEHVVRTICRAVEGGAGLSESMSLHPNVFSNEFVQLVRAGERTGTIPRSFQELRKYLEWRERLAGDIQQATTYPLVITVVLGAFVLYLFSFVIPKIALILNDMKVALPAITRLVLWCSDFAVNTWWIWLLAAIFIPIGFTMGVRHSPLFARWIDEVRIRLPIFGPLQRMIIQSRFTQNFSVLHRAGIPILENLELCVGLVGNRLYGEALRRAGADIREGSTLSSSLRGSGLFSGLVIRMIAVGENTGSLDNSLRHAADYYDQEVPRRVKKVFSIFEPTIILFLVAVVGTVALAIFMPILSIQGGMR